MFVRQTDTLLDATRQATITDEWGNSSTNDSTFDHVAGNVTVTGNGLTGDLQRTVSGTDKHDLLIQFTNLANGASLSGDVGGRRTKACICVAPSPYRFSRRRAEPRRHVEQRSIHILKIKK